LRSLLNVKRLKEHMLEKSFESIKLQKEKKVQFICRSLAEMIIHFASIHFWLLQAIVSYLAAREYDIENTRNTYLSDVYA